MTFSDSSFIGHIRGGAAYFIGNVRGDSIYIFDHASSSAINFRISGYRIHEHDNEPNVSSADWLNFTVFAFFNRATHSAHLDFVRN